MNASAGLMSRVTAMRRLRRETVCGKVMIIVNKWCRHADTCFIRSPCHRPSMSQSAFGTGICTLMKRGSMELKNACRRAFCCTCKFASRTWLRCFAVVVCNIMDGKVYCVLDEGSFCNDGHSDGSNIDIDEAASAKFIAKAGMHATICDKRHQKGRRTTVQIFFVFGRRLAPDEL